MRCEGTIVNVLVIMYEVIGVGRQNDVSELCKAHIIV